MKKKKLLNSETLMEMVANQSVKSFWNKVKNAKPKSGKSSEIVIYDMIDDYALKSVRRQMANAKGDITVKINSWGGDVFAGFAIFNELSEYEKGKVTTKVMGMAASAAALIFMAGDKRYMKEQSMLMFHKSWNFAMGNADDLRETAALLDKIDAMMISLLDSKLSIDGSMNDFLLKEEFLTLAEAVDIKAAENMDDDDMKNMDDDDTHNMDDDDMKNMDDDDTHNMDDDDMKNMDDDDTHNMDDDDMKNMDDDEPKDADDDKPYEEDVKDALARKRLFIENEIQAMKNHRRFRI